MKLLVISNTPHFLRDGKTVGWGPTVQEVDALATIFDEVTYLGCLYDTEAPLSALPYQSKNVHFIPLEPSGGRTLGSKIRILRMTPKYINQIQQWLPWGDVIHVRCPANIPMIALGILSLSQTLQPRWVKYAGNWRPNDKEAISYTIQRWILQKNLHHGVVTINGNWKNQPEHIFSFHNPCLTNEEILNARKAVAAKSFEAPYHFLFVGSLATSKGVGTILEILALMKEMKIEFECTFVGDGPERSYFQDQAYNLGLSEATHFLGWLPRTSLGKYYERAHCILLPSGSEGWPKVLSEAMAYGCVALASPVSSIPEILEKTGAGLAIDPGRPDLYAKAILDFTAQPSLWKQFSNAGMASAQLFSYDTYLSSVKSMAKKAWNVSL